MDCLDKRDGSEPTGRRSTDLQTETGGDRGQGVSGRKVEGVARVAICQSATSSPRVLARSIKSGNWQMNNELAGDRAGLAPTDYRSS
jgi:hypothetical protein